ncbi:PR domain zinc finger protein 15-like [Anoplophora glabripennis]|uniref:PR domain zinc finger protein 15-like n=1 Tax=Anoplophora glabripennis TaxID=217634 RepID=UPI000874E443|nr:PR domain zinc finger protein 15-like [Anoplophora glabripennis]
MEPLTSEIFHAEADFDKCKSDKPSQCGICGENHSVKECRILKLINHIPDKTIPSKARLTLPDSLEIKKLCDGTHNVYTRCLIKRGTQFGPFQAKKLFTLHPAIDFPLKIFTNAAEDFSEYFLDTSDENECSWMIFISPASDMEEQNVICYQDGEDLYYGTIKDIYPGEPLKVWYSSHYAAKMKKVLLNNTGNEDNNVEKQSNDLEAILRKKKNITPRESWSCKFCGKVEKELSVFAVHLLDHYRAQANKVCAICKGSFQTRRMLKKHLKTVHGNNLKQTAETIKESEISNIKINEHDSKDTSVGGPLLLNNISADSLDNSSLLLSQSDLLKVDLNGIENQNIMMETENLNLNVDNIINDNVKQLDHFNFELKELESEQLICDICLKSFVKLKSLIQHLEQHTGKFLCHQCNMVFARKENLMYHTCNVFYKIKCPLCDKIFVQRKFLTQHIKGFHDKQFTCRLCNKFYDCKQALQMHTCAKVPVHKKEKFPCNVCSKIFFNKKNLYEHLARHRKSKENEKIVCEVCNVTLTSRKSYLKHVKMHDGSFHSCDICKKVFVRSDGLREHKIQVHSAGNQVETCEICKKTMKSKKLLKTHMETHSANKLHKCEICQASFKQRYNLTKHKKMHQSLKSRLESLFREDALIYSCPKCDKNMKLKSSLVRHMRSLHADCEISSDIIKPKLGKLTARKPDGSMTGEDDVMDLKETIENMNYNTDEVNNCTEINIEIDKILNNTDNIDNFLSDSNDRIVENLISIAAKENELGTMGSEYAPKEVCLSMPDLTADQEIKLGENAYILDNGTIVEPQESSSKVVVYILDQDKFT